MTICEEEVIGFGDTRTEIAKNMCAWILDLNASKNLFNRFEQIENQGCNTEETFFDVWTDTKLLNPIFRDLFNHKNFGFDLPVWFNAENATKKIMIIGQDPKRKNQEAGKLTVSSPWGLHSSLYSNGKKVGTEGPSRPASLMNILINEFLKNKASVYVTDSVKLYVNDENEGNNKIYDYLNESSSEEIEDAFIDTLSCEISIFQPDYILFVGHEAEENCKLLFEGNNAKDIPHEYIIHPNGRPNGHGLTDESYTALAHKILEKLGL